MPFFPPSFARGARGNPGSGNVGVPSTGFFPTIAYIGLPEDHSPRFAASLDYATVPSNELHSGRDPDDPSNDQEWLPTRFVRMERPLLSSQLACKIVTDAGPAYLKAICDGSSPHKLARELVGSQLALHLGLPVPEFAIMAIDDSDEIELYDGRHAHSGPAFVSRAIPEAVVWGGSTTELNSVEHPEILARLVSFDTLSRNWDRHPPPSMHRKPNRRNLLIAASLNNPERTRLVPIDFGECFTSRSELSTDVCNIQNIKDEQLYGLFPEFCGFLRRADIEEAAQELQAIEVEAVRSMVSRIPDQWAVPEAARAALVRMICGRAKYLSENLVGLIEPHCFASGLLE